MKKVYSSVMAGPFAFKVGIPLGTVVGQWLVVGQRQYQSEPAGRQRSPGLVHQWLQLDGVSQHLLR